MCGLTGFVAGNDATADELRCTVRRMSAALSHRGPDGSGEWTDVECGVALGFRRLAILDLSPAGDQPMSSRSGRYIASCNGEIYNYEELRRLIADAGGAREYRGHSDTEVMLAAFDAWGVEAAIRRFNGMFAIAVWDRAERRLQLARDRMGVKPLYYGFAGRTFLYASELKGIRQHPDFRPALNRTAVHLYLRYLSVPEPHCIYDGIVRLMPGTIATFDPNSRNVEISAYWSLLEVVRRGIRDPFRGPAGDAANEVEALARDAVHLRMAADVPVGVFLSGGIDSSLVAALMQDQSLRPVRSFSVGFADAEYDEARFARAVATHLGTDHTEVIMTAQDVISTIPNLPEMYDEPFADSSQIPTHLVAAVARRHVTVALSGDGGDELFGGYVRYTAGRSLNRLMSLPAGLRDAVARMLAALPAHSWDRVLSLCGSLLPASLRRPASGERVHKLARMLASGDPDALYFELVSHWRELVDPATGPAALVTWPANAPPLADAVERMMYFDQISYLPNDILTKVDRASMAVSLEAREPLLDYRLVELAWTLPLSMKVSAGSGKHLLRRILRRHVPEALVDRPKMGFGIPLEHWLRGPLRDWADSLLQPADIASHGLFDPGPIRAKWSEHLSGRADWKHEIWAILMLQAWLRAHGSPAVAAA